jgi:tetrapyrrole methylase family protein/MazG family protein
LASEDNLDKFETLVGIIVRLRGPGGCPWDREQTHESLREALLEECYEVLEALDEGDSQRLAEELGDLLMQIVFHAQIASELDEFQLRDVLQNINRKLLYRHPHVFGSAKVKDAGEVLASWEALKKREKGDDSSLLKNVPRKLPALGYSQEIQDRAARTGFDWENIEGIIDKLAEEVCELKQAGDQTEKEHEFGDLLFTLVNIARWLEIDSESALREANRRFYKRFSYMEKACRQRGVSLADLSFAEQNELWEEAKKSLESE